MKYPWTKFFIGLTGMVAVLTYLGMITDAKQFPLPLVLFGEIMMCISVYLMWKRETKLLETEKVE